MLTAALVWGMRGGLVLLLGMPLVYSPGTSFPFIVSKAIYARVIIEVIGVVWFLLALRSSRYRPSNSWVLWALGFNLVVLFVSAIVGVSFTKSIWSNYERMLGVWDMAHWTLLALIAGSFVVRASEWRVLLNLNLAVTAAVSLIALTQAFGLRWLPDIERACRAGATLGNPSFLAAILVVVILTTAGLFARSLAPGRVPDGGDRGHSIAWSATRGTWVLRTYWILAGLLATWVLFLTGTQGAMVGLIAGAVSAPAVLWLRGGRRGLLPMSLASGGVLVIVIGLAAVDLSVGLHPTAECESTVVTHRLFGGAPEPADSTSESESAQTPASGLSSEDVTSSAVSSSSVGTRLASIRWGMKSFLDYPIFGLGPENYLAAFARYVQPSILEYTERPFDQAHNKIVETLATTGTVGTISYLAVWGALVWAVVRRRRRDVGEEVMAYGVLSALTGYFVQNLFLFDTPSMLLQLTILVAWVVRDEMNAPTTESADSEDADKSRIPRSLLRTAKVGVAGGVIVAAILSLIYLNYRPLAANRTFVRAFQESNAPGIFAVAEDSFDAFPDLANRGRRHLFRQISSIWDQLSADDRQTAINLVLEQSTEGMKAEPDNILLINATIEFLQTIAADTSGSIEVSGRLLAIAQSLAPDYVQTHQLLATQEILRGDYVAARRISEEYVSRSPNAERFFATILDEASVLEALDNR